MEWSLFLIFTILYDLLFCSIPLDSYKAFALEFQLKTALGLQ